MFGMLIWMEMSKLRQLAQVMAKFDTRCYEMYLVG